MDGSRETVQMNHPVAEEAASSTVELFEQIGTDTPGTACFAPVLERWLALSKEANYEGAGAIPRDQAFWLDSWPEFAGRISIVDRVDDGQDFRYAIYAGAIVHAGGVDMTGRLVSEFPYQDFRDAVLQSHRNAIEKQTPEIWRFRHVWRGASYDYCTLYLPVRRAHDGSIRLHTIIVNTDPERRRLYSARFATGSAVLAPEDLLQQR